MTLDPPEAASIVSTTVDDEAAARRIAETLVAERLAACVQLLPGVLSTYRWQGRLDQTREWLLQCKTTAARVPQLIARLKMLHPYQTPEILAVTVTTGDRDYLAWVTENTTDPVSN